LENKGGKKRKGIDHSLNAEAIYRSDKQQRKPKDDGKRETISPDGKRVIPGSSDKTVRILDAETGK